VRPESGEESGMNRKSYAAAHTKSTQHRTSSRRHPTGVFEVAFRCQPPHSCGRGSFSAPLESLPITCALALALEKPSEPIPGNSPRKKKHVRARRPLPPGTLPNYRQRLQEVARTRSHFTKVKIKFPKSLQFGVFRLGLLQDGNVGVGVFP
jgi:hypothetical protein